jgi:hypothetical protein
MWVGSSAPVPLQCGHIIFIFWLFTYFVTNTFMLFPLYISSKLTFIFIFNSVPFYFSFFLFENPPPPKKPLKSILFTQKYRMGHRLLHDSLPVLFLHINHIFSFFQDLTKLHKHCWFWKIFQSHQEMNFCQDGTVELVFYRLFLSHLKGH